MYVVIVFLESYTDSDWNLHNFRESKISGLNKTRQSTDFKALNLPNGRWGSYNEMQLKCVIWQTWPNRLKPSFVSVGTTCKYYEGWLIVVEF